MLSGSKNNVEVDQVYYQDFYQESLENSFKKVAECLFNDSLEATAFDSELKGLVNSLEIIPNFDKRQGALWGTMTITANTTHPFFKNLFTSEMIANNKTVTVGTSFLGWLIIYAQHVGKADRASIEKLLTQIYIGNREFTFIPECIFSTKIPDSLYRIDLLLPEDLLNLYSIVTFKQILTELSVLTRSSQNIDAIKAQFQALFKEVEECANQAFLSGYFEAYCDLANFYASLKDARNYRRILSYAPRENNPSYLDPNFETAKLCRQTNDWALLKTICDEISNDTEENKKNPYRAEIYMIYSEHLASLEIEDNKEAQLKEAMHYAILAERVHWQNITKIQEETDLNKLRCRQFLRADSTSLDIERIFTGITEIEEEKNRRIESEFATIITIQRTIQSIRLNLIRAAAKPSIEDKSEELFDTGVVPLLTQKQKYDDEQKSLREKEKSDIQLPSAKKTKLN